MGAQALIQGGTASARKPWVQRGYGRACVPIAPLSWALCGAWRVVRGKFKFCFWELPGIFFLNIFAVQLVESML